MSNDSRFVLAQLVRTGLWSSMASLFDHKRLVLDADSVVTYLYKYCATSHLKRHKSLVGKSAQASRARHQINYYAATLVNYQEFSRYVEHMLDLFASHSIELIIVYRGKYMEAPLFGLLPAQFKKNTQRASDWLLMLIEYNNYLTELAESSANSASATSQARHQKLARHHQQPPIELYMSQLRPSRPNLALNVFKQIVNSRRKTSSTKRTIQTHQAFYSPYPTMAKLARDYKCPVLTNDGDFIIMDVRAGFVLFEDFFATYLASHNQVLARHNSTTSISSSTSTGTGSTIASSASSARGLKLARSPRSPAPGLKDTKALFQEAPAQASGRIRCHYHAQFLRQHPGINSPLALQLFPFTAGEFIVQHAKSLVKMKIYDREFHDKDLINIVQDLRAHNSVRKYHLAAARLEMASRYLGSKDPDLLTSLIRGEAHRLAQTASTFEEDYRELYNYYAVAYNFRNRLKFVLKYLADTKQLAHMELCLASRECTADYLLSLLCCSIGRMSSVCYNKSMQFEDLQTKHSACSMLDRSKRLLMSWLSDNKSYKSVHSTKISSKQRELISARYTMASLTVIDRQQKQLVERTLATTTSSSATAAASSSSSDKAKKKDASGVGGGGNNNIAKAGSSGRSGASQAHQVEESVRARMTLAKIAQQSSDSKQDAATFIELAFNVPVSSQAGSMTTLELLKLDHATGVKLKLLSDKRSQHELAILLHLHRYSLECGSQDDHYFKQTYSKLGRHFESALVNHAIYMNYIFQQSGAISAGKQSPAASPSRGSSSSSSSAAAASFKQLVDLINKYDLENVTNCNFYAQVAVAAAAASAVVASSVADKKSKKSDKNKLELGKSAKASKYTQKSQLVAARDKAKLVAESGEIKKQVRHTIELLNSSIEAYCELNALLNYPMPQLSLSTAYNPILLFNLTLYSYELSSSANAAASVTGKPKHDNKQSM